MKIFNLTPIRCFLIISSMITICLVSISLSPLGVEAKNQNKDFFLGSYSLLVENSTQFAPLFRYHLDAGRRKAWFNEREIWVQLFNTVNKNNDLNTRQGLNLRFSFVDANSQPTLAVFNRLETSVSYLIGNDPARWQRRTNLWEGLRYQELYPGINLVINASNENQIPWLLELNSDNSIQDIRLRVDGVLDASIEGEELQLWTEIGIYNLPLPILQISEEVKVPFHSLTKPQIYKVGEKAFEISAPYQSVNKPLRVVAQDLPDELGYSTFLGGSSWDIGYGIDIDESGAAYVVGRSPSHDFPITPGVFSAEASEVDIFVAKINPRGDGLVYATFIGGYSTDTGNAIDVENGIAYITGDTWSADFPLMDGIKGENDAFVLALNQDGTDLIYNQLIGGSGEDYGYGVAVEDGEAYLTGITWSDDFPASGYFGNGDAFVAKMSRDGEVIYTALLGGSLEDSGFDLVVHEGEATITGQTWSPDFPLVPGSFRGASDAFVSRINQNGGIDFITLLGGVGNDSSRSIVIDDNGIIYITGFTSSADFPVSQGFFRGITDGFLAQLDPDGFLVNALYLGGTNLDESHDLLLVENRDVILVGRTESTNLPVTGDSYQRALGGLEDGFLARVNLNESNPYKYISYLGGSQEDRIYAITMDKSGNLYLTGYTKSYDFPITSNAFDLSIGGSSDAFVLKFGQNPLPTTISTNPVIPASPTPQSLPTKPSPTMTSPSIAGEIPEEYSISESPTKEVSGFDKTTQDAEQAIVTIPTIEKTETPAESKKDSQISSEEFTDTGDIDAESEVPIPIPDQEQPTFNVWLLIILGVVLALAIFAWVGMRVIRPSNTK